MLQYLKTLKLHIVPYSLLHKKCVIHIHILTMTYFHCWKFALWFFMQITRFLWVQEWNSNLFFSKRLLLMLLLLFKKEQLERRATDQRVAAAICSWPYKWEKQWKTAKKHGENNIFIWENCSFFESKRENSRPCLFCLTRR